MTVLEAVERSNTSLSLFNKATIKDAQALLLSSEDVLWAQACSIYKEPTRGELSAKLPSVAKMLPGILVVTSQRIFFINKQIGTRTIQEISLSSIRSIDSKANFVLEVLRIAGVSNMIITFGSFELMAHLRNAINEALEKRNAPQAAAPAPQPADNDLSSTDIEQLQALKQLYDTGVLTEEEFAAKKAQILGL